MPTNYGTKKMRYEKRRDKENSSLFILANDAAPRDSAHGWITYESTASKCYCPDCRKVFDIDQIPVIAHNIHAMTNIIDLSYSDFKNMNIQQDITCPQCGKNDKYVFLAPQGEEPLVDDIPESQKNSGHINYKGSWRIPSLAQGRYLFEFTDENGQLTRFDDNMMLEETVVFPSGKVFAWETEYSQTTDLINHRIMSYRTRIDGRVRQPIGVAQDIINPFNYFIRGENVDMHTLTDVAEIKKVTGLTYQEYLGPIILGKDPVFGKAINHDREFKTYTNETLHPDQNGQRYGYGYYSTNDKSLAGWTVEDLDEMFKETSKIKTRSVMESLAKKLPHPVYANLVHNGLNLSSHSKESTEENTPISPEKQALHYYMCVRYPAAVEYAASRAELRITNYEFAEKRKADADPSYTAKTATDSARAKFFREEMNYVAEQLVACDDKVLNEIRMAGAENPTYIFTKDENGKNCIKKVDKYVSPENDNPDDMQLMKDRLSFFVFGLREGYPVPNDIAVKLKDSKTLQPATQATKKLKSAFNMDPIATASNVYTLQKLKITDPNYVKSVLDLISQQSPEVNPADKRIQGRRVPQKKGYSPFVNAGVMAPIRDKTALRFLRLYGQTHDTASMISDIYDNTENPLRAEKWNQVIEDIRLYRDVINNPNVTLIQTKKDIPDESKEINANADEIHQLRKTQLRNYLENADANGLQLAYRDFSTIYGQNTVEMINMLAREIKQDVKMDEIKHFADSEGMDAALAKYTDDLSSYADPANAISEHKYFTDRKMVIATRNNKPLFERSIGEIHDELSEIGRKTVTENDYLNLTEKQKAMNETYEVDLSTLPRSQWIENEPVYPEGTMGSFSFTILDNKFAYVRLATDLRNCVATGSYFNSAKSGKTLIAAMRNENGQPVACIELKKQTPDENGREWYIAQFEGYRDGVVDVRYLSTFEKWCEDHGIDATHDPNGEIADCRRARRGFFHGENADYHQDEYDPVLNTTLKINTAQAKRQERINKAVELYGGSAEHGPNLPAVPEDLQDFSVH